MKKFFYGLSALLVSCCLCGNDKFLTVAGKQGLFYFDNKNINIPVLELAYINYLAKDAKRNIYYAAISKLPDKKAKGGAVAVLDGGMNKLNSKQMFYLQGRTPSHITLSPDGNYLYTANYSNSDIAEIALEENGYVKAVRFIKHSGKGVLRRQKAPHPHQCVFDPEGKALYVCDLGTDEIFVYPYTQGKGIDESKVEKLKLAPGSGPRHLVFAADGNTLYCANELSSTVTTFVRKNNKWQLVKTVSTLKEPFRKNFPGAIKISSCGKFVLVSNRGHNSIALFETAAGGNLTLLDTVSSDGDFPYDILLLDEDRKVVVCNYRSNSVTIFKFDKLQKKLLPESKYSVNKAKMLAE